MKRIIFGVLLIVLIFPAVNAQQTTTTEPCVTPDSFLWGLDKAFDQITLLLTAGDVNKAKKGLEIAEERLAEIKEMIEENKLEAAEKAQEAHGQTLGKVKEKIKGIEEDDSLEEIEHVIEIEKELEEHDEGVEQTFGELKVKIEVKGELSQSQKVLVDSILNNLKDQIVEIEIEIENKKNKTKIKIKQETGRDGEEVEKEIKEDIGLSNFEKERAEKMLKKAENKWEDVVEKAEKYNVSVPDKSTFDELIARGDEALTQEKYEEAKDRYEAAKDHAEELKDGIEGAGESVEEREIEVEIGEGKAKVNIEIGDSEWDFELETTDLDTIINEISERTRLSKEEINNIMKVEIEDEESGDEEEEDEEDNETESNNEE